MNDIEEKNHETLNRDLDQDMIATPLPMPQDTVALWGGPPPARRSIWMWVLVVICLVLSVASLLLSASLVYGLWSMRGMALDGLDSAISALDGLEGEGFQYEYHFQQTIPVDQSIPFKQDIIFPFKGDVPINTTVRVPIEAGALGTFVIDVPIDTTVYVSTTVPVSIDQSFDVQAEIPVDMMIPIEIQFDDPELSGLVDNARAWLMSLRDTIQGMVPTGVLRFVE